MNDAPRIPDLIDRLARLGAAEAWGDDLNPGQAAALGYLAHANRFSRQPSHVADYLASTRGTVSQTLKALTQKGLIFPEKSASDRRSIRYGLTDAGQALVARRRDLDRAVAALPAAEARALDDGLSDLLRAVLAARNMRSFGMCATCAHHETRPVGGYCRLLRADLEPAEAGQICHEHVA